MEMLQKILDAIPGGESALIASIAAGLEIAMRLLKTEKPKSMILVASAVAKLVVKIIEKADAFVSALIPQNIK